MLQLLAFVSPTFMVDAISVLLEVTVNSPESSKRLNTAGVPGSTFLIGSNAITECASLTEDST